MNGNGELKLDRPVIMFVLFTAFFATLTWMRLSIVDNRVENARLEERITCILKLEDLE